MCQTFNDIFVLFQPHTHATPPVLQCHIFILFLDQPSVLKVCGSAQCCVSVWIGPVVCVCVMEVCVTHGWHMI